MSKVLAPNFSVLAPQQADFKDMNDNQIQQLKQQGFPTGLAKSLAECCLVFPMRIWVVDNSGSMQANDGHRIVDTFDRRDVRLVSCTRWEEIRDCVMYHCQMSALLEAPTTFRLLNHPGCRAGTQQFGIAETGLETIGADLANARTIMAKGRPTGATPLTDHVREIHSMVSVWAPQLEASGKQVAVILATDGLPTDPFGQASQYIRNEFVDSLRSLEGLPVWLVIRLCTDEESVVDFYNNLDNQLELSVEVLDDFQGEAEEVYEENPWLNYALPIHRIREMGYHDRVFDLIDERPLTKDELRHFVCLLFGEENFDGVPDPNADWRGFINVVERIMETESHQWNPIKGKVAPWLDLKMMNKRYGEKMGWWSSKRRWRSVGSSCLGK